MQFIEYPKCSTCKKAKCFLENNNIKFIDRNIKEKNPSYEELNNWVDNYNVEIKKLFNTSGIKYKELNLKDKLNNMSKSEKLNLLSSDGMLVKRPILVSKDKILVGFKLNEWEEYFKV